MIMRLIVSGALAAAALSAVSRPVAAQEREQEAAGKGCRLVWVSGEVAKVDWVGSRFAVRPLGPGPGFAGWEGWTYPSSQPDLRFQVTKETLFVQQTDTLSFIQLEQSDYVSVLFCVDFSSELRAIRVVINNPYPKN